MESTSTATNQTKGGTSRPRRNPGRRSLAIGSGGLAIALALVMALAPSASATRVLPTVTHGPPYSGVTYVLSSTSTSGCGLSSIVTVPNFNLTTGVGTIGVSSSDTNCAPSLNGNYGSASGQTGLASNSFTSTTGVHKVTAKWTLHWTFAIKTQVPTGLGGAEAIGTVSISVLVFDSNATSIVNQTSWFKQFIDFGNTTTSSSGSANKTLSMNVNLVSGHVYRIYTSAFVYAYTTISQSVGATASAKVDLGTGKNKAKIVSYSFT